MSLLTNFLRASSPPKEVKVVASDRFISMNQTDNRPKYDSDSLYNAFYQSALNHIDVFKRNSDINELRRSAKKLIEALKYNKNSVECYFWLSYIYFIFGQERLSQKYLKIAERIDPAYPKIQQLKGIINSK